MYFLSLFILYLYMFPACCFCQRTNVAQDLVNGVLNEIQLTLVSSLKDFGWSGGFYIGVIFPFFLECVYFDIWYVYSYGCRCTGIGVVWGFTNSECELFLQLFSLECELFFFFCYALLCFCWLLRLRLPCHLLCLFFTFLDFLFFL